MKTLFVLSLSMITTGLAQAEWVDYKTITGVFLRDTDCAETGYALWTQTRGNVCLGFHSDDLTEANLVEGVRYRLAGYETEDGFFVTEFAD